jgi:hypothetical protein
MLKAGKKAAMKKKMEEEAIDEQELSSKQAYDMGRGVQKLATKPFGRPGFNTQGRSAATGTVQGNVPGVGSGKITANRVDAPGGYSQATVTATRPSGSPIGSAKIDDKGARMTQIGANRVNEEESNIDHPNKRKLDVAKPYGRLTKDDFTKLRAMKEQAAPKVDPHGGDTTSPSSMGIKKPNYATGTPDYAKPKTQTVNSAAKTSLPPGTMKEEKESKFAKVMREFQKRKLHSGSKSGPVVTDPKQAKAIAASESGISRKK